MEGLVKGDIVVIEFPYSNMKISKRRPVIVLKVPRGEDIIALQITGSSQEKEYEIPIKNDDFMQGSLKRDSFGRIDKIFSVEKSLIKYKIGRIKKDKFDKIIKNICYFLMG